MSELDFYKIATVVSPIITATLTSTITYFYSQKIKKYDILYQNKIDECMNIVSKLVEYKMFCIGRISYFDVSEVSPHREESSGSLKYRMSISTVVELNTFYLSQKSKASLNDVVDKMNFVCKAELAVMGGEEVGILYSAYEFIIEKIEQCIKTVYQDLK